MNDWHRFKSAPKRPPPRDGIRVRKAGATWWGRRWIEALERLSANYENRLARGRSYARGGRTHSLVVKAGLVTARVTGTRATPYKVHIRLRCLSDANWSKAIAAMAAEARFSAALLAGEMPTDIDDAFGHRAGGLFPARSSDLSTSCSCPDWANPCKHVAATHYVLGEALDRDPFLLFELRGRARDEVLAALRTARSAPVKRSGRSKRSGTSSATEARMPEQPIAAMSLGRLRVADYDRLRAPLPTLNLTFATPPVPGAVIRQLGHPPGWSQGRSPAALLAPFVRVAAEAARHSALLDEESAAPGS